MSVYDFTVKTKRGEDKSLSDYKGKVLLIVNTASKCGFTPQFEGLQKLYKDYKDKGFDKSNSMAEKLTEALKEHFPEYLEGDGIKWNFTKFLIDREGNIVERFEPTTTPSAIAKDIEKLL